MAWAVLSLFGLGVLQLARIAQGAGGRPPNDGFRFDCYQALTSDPSITAGQAVRKNTMLSKERLANVHQLVAHAIAAGIAGDWVETGVWRGGTSLVAARVIQRSRRVSECPQLERTVWLFDSFEGLPKPRVEDRGRSRGGRPMDPPGSYSFSGGVDTVASLFRAQGFAPEIVRDRAALEALSARSEREAAVLPDATGGLPVRLVRGWFNETLALAPVRNISILRLDGDMYSSTMDSLHAFYKRLAARGFMIIDDYGWWIQCKRAVDDFFIHEQGWMPAFVAVDFTGRWMQKPHLLQISPAPSV